MYSALMTDQIFRISLSSTDRHYILHNAARDVPKRWRGKPFVGMDDHRPMFAHQRLFLRHVLDTEERALLRSMGFEEVRVDVSTERIVHRVNPNLSTDDHLVRPNHGGEKTVSYEFNDEEDGVAASSSNSTDDTKVASSTIVRRRGISRVFLFDEERQRVVLVSIGVNRFCNNVDLFAVPYNAAQRQYLYGSPNFVHGNQLLKSSAFLSAAFEIDFATKKVHGPWLIVRILVRSTMSDTIPRIVYSHRPPDDLSSCCGKCTDPDRRCSCEHKVSACRLDTVCRNDSCWCVEARRSNEYERTVRSRERVLNPNDRLYFDRLLYLQQMCVPRCYTNTFVGHYRGSGLLTAAFSLCLWNNSRGNWFVVESNLIDRLIDTALSFRSCVFFVVRTFVDFFNFYKHYDYHSCKYNVVVIESGFYAMTFRDSRLSSQFLVAACPLRVFFCQNRDAFDKTISVEMMLGKFNYVLWIDPRVTWELIRESHVYTYVSISPESVEKMFQLPAVRRVEHAVNHYCDTDDVYDPNFRFSCAAVNDVVLFNLLTDAYMRLDVPESHVDPVKQRANENRVDALVQKVCHNGCVVCLSRVTDYYALKCCCNLVCVVCFPRLETRTCPMCRAKIGIASLVPFILPDSEYEAANDDPLNLPPRFRGFCEPLRVLKYDLDSLSRDVGFIVCRYPQMAFKVVVVDLFHLYDDDSYKFRTFQTFRWSSYSRQILRNFQFCRMHSILVVRDVNELYSYDLSFVTHVYFMEKPEHWHYFAVMHVLQRYPRRSSLVVHEFLHFYEKSAVKKYATYLTPPIDVENVNDE